MMVIPLEMTLLRFVRPSRIFQIKLEQIRIFVSSIIIPYQNNMPTLFRFIFGILLFMIQCDILVAAQGNPKPVNPMAARMRAQAKLT
jgi:hypothetical protein